MKLDWIGCIGVGVIIVVVMVLAALKGCAC